MSAGTVGYENNVRKLIDLLPPKTIITEFNEKEKIRLAGNEVALEELKKKFDMKIDSHDAIVK
jgi:hypothetical protein